MSWKNVGKWLKKNSGPGTALVGSLLSGNVPGAIAAGTSLVASATGTDDPDHALKQLQQNPDSLLKLKALYYEDEKSVRKHLEEIERLKLGFDKQITDRHAADMMSDSWLSKNIRPMSLIFLTISTVFLAFLTIFFLDVTRIELLKAWLTLLTALLVIVYVFYFSSRGIEKFKAIKNIIRW